MIYSLFAKSRQSFFYRTRENNFVQTILKTKNIVQLIENNANYKHMLHTIKNEDFICGNIPRIKIR